MFIFGAEQLTGYSSNANLEDEYLQSDEIDSGGLFGTGVSFNRFFVFVAFGYGLPSDTPSWFSVFFILLQSMVTILSVGFVVSSIWNG